MLRAVSLVLVSLGVALFPAAPATAHARVVATSPESGSILERPPAEVTIRFDNKLVTPEGDPIRVYAPDGERVDRGAGLREGGQVLAVGLARDSLPEGAYQVEYRVISEDTHLITGHFTFHSRAAATISGGGGAAVAREPASGAGTSAGLVDACGDCGQLPHLAAAVAVGLVVIGGGRRAVARARGRLHQLWGPAVSPGAARVTPARVTSTRPAPNTVAPADPAPAAATAGAPVPLRAFPGSTPSASAPPLPAVPPGPAARPPDRAPIGSDHWASMVATAARVLADVEGWWPERAAADDTGPTTGDGPTRAQAGPARMPGVRDGRT